MGARRVLNKITGLEHDVPAGHWSLSSPDYVVLEGVGGGDSTPTRPLEQEGGLIDPAGADTEAVEAPEESAGGVGTVESTETPESPPGLEEGPSESPAGERPAKTKKKKGA